MKSFKQHLSEDLRQWFKQKWVRMDTQGNIKGDCAREPGEGKPKCLPQAKAQALGKEGRAKAARRKRREDPNPERRGAPINVKTESVDEACWTGYKAVGTKKKGNKIVPNCVPEEVEKIEEKNVPTSPDKWARAKAAAKSKFAVYPSAYANAWASKKYKSMGGGWKATSEETVDEKWSQKYKSSIDCDNPKGFSQRAHCQGKKKDVNEDGGAAAVAGPTNAVGSGAIAGTGGKGGEPGVDLRKKKTPVLLSTFRRKAPVG